MHALRRARAAQLRRDDFMRKLVDMQYERNDLDFHRGTFRVRGDVVEVFPAYEDERAIRDRVLRRRGRRDLPRSTRCAAACSRSRAGAWSTRTATTCRRSERLEARDRRHPRRARRAHRRRFKRENKLLEAQRLEQRTMYDLEMLDEMGFCHGVENYSRWLDGRVTDQPPYTLIDYFPKDFLCFVDESHVDRAPDRRHVPRRPPAQGDAGRLRLPPAVGARQPAADVRGVGAAGRPGAVRLGDAGRVRAREERRRGRRADHPADRPDGSRRSRCGRPRTRSTTCSARSASASRWATACWSRR